MRSDGRESLKVLTSKDGFFCVCVCVFLPETRCGSLGGVCVSHSLCESQSAVTHTDTPIYMLGSCRGGIHIQYLSMDTCVKKYSGKSKSTDSTHVKVRKFSFYTQVQSKNDIYFFSTKANNAFVVTYMLTL